VACPPPAQPSPAIAPSASSSPDGAVASATPTVPAPASSAPPAPRVEPSCHQTSCTVGDLDDEALAYLEKSAPRVDLFLALVYPTSAGVANLGRVPGLAGVELRGRVDDVTPVAKLAGLRGFEAVGFGGASLEPIGRVKSLLTLKIALCEKLRDTDLRALGDLRELFLLRIQNCESLTSVAPIGALPKLDQIEIVNTNVRSLEGLRGTRARQIKVQGSVEDVSALASATEAWRLELIDMPKATDFSALASLRKLDRLEVQSAGMTKLPQLAAPELKHASFARCAALTDVGGLAGAPALEDLELSHTRVSDLRALAGLRSLVVLFLVDTKVTDLTPLAKLPALKAVIVSDDMPAATKTALTKLRPDIGVKTETQARQATLGPH
jgi:hypothetical protein